MADGFSNFLGYSLMLFLKECFHTHVVTFKVKKGFHLAKTKQSLALISDARVVQLLAKGTDKWPYPQSFITFTAMQAHALKPNDKALSGIVGPHSDNRWVRYSLDSNIMHPMCPTHGRLTNLTSWGLLLFSVHSLRL